MIIKPYMGSRMTFRLIDFVRQSNEIERIIRKPTKEELEAHMRFIHGPLTIQSLIKLVDVLQPGAKLRNEPGMDVCIGDYAAPRGGPSIVQNLGALLRYTHLSPYKRHIAYEALHPFMDGNGRSGRALWLMDMGGIDKIPLGFLHHFYYQTLKAQGLVVLRRTLVT